MHQGQKNKPESETDICIDWGVKINFTIISATNHS